MTLDPISYKKAKDAEKLAQSVIDGEFDLGVARTKIDEKLNDLEEQYAPKLNDVTAQLAQTLEEVSELENKKADKTEVDDLVQSKADKEEVLADLNLKRDKSARIGINDLDGETLGIIQDGTGGNPINVLSDPRDYSVSPQKTTFLIPLGNIFNKNGERLKGGYFGASGSWITNQNFDTILVPIKINTTYANNLPQNYNLSFLDENKELISVVPYTEWDNIVVPDNPDIYYVGVIVHVVNTNLDIIMIVEGSTLPSEYIPYKFTFSNDIFIEPAQPKAENMNFLLFGDSITETATISEDGLTYQEGARDNWFTYAKEVLKPKTFRNYARSGASFKDQSVAGDRRKSLSEQINMAIANNENPDVIVVSAGVNDGGSNLGSFETAMSKGTLDDLDRTNIYEAVRWAFWKLREAFPDAVFFYGLPIQKATNEQNEKAIEAFIKMAKRYNFILIDGLNESGIIREFEVPSGEGRYLYDGLHPNVEGRKKMANLYTRVILNSLNY